MRPTQLGQNKADSKESRHHFALYGSGEKDADIAARKTHNVGPAASTSEVIVLNVSIIRCMSMIKSQVIAFILLADP